MPTADDVLSVAYAELGYRETGNNNNKFGIEYGLNYQPWCCIFVWWCFKHANASSLFYGGGKVASCTSLWNFYKSRGQTYSDVRQAQPGDIVIFSAGNIHHVGIFYRKVNGGFQTIDGNYGDKVAIHTASWGTPYGIIKVAYDGRKSLVPVVEDDPEAPYKLGNIIVPTDKEHYKGQPATGNSNDNCIQLRMVDPENKKIRKITKVVKVSESGDVDVISRHLKLISSDAYQRILHTYSLDRAYDFNIYEQGAFKINILFSVIRPNWYARPINIIKNVLLDSGWGLELTTNNYIRFYQTTFNSSSASLPRVKSVVWKDVRINTSSTTYNKIDPETGEELSETCTTGMYWYELELYKPEKSLDVQLKLDGVELPPHKIELSSTKLKQLDKNRSGRIIRFGDSYESSPLVFFANYIELNGSRDNDKHNETYTGNLNYNMNTDYSHEVVGGNVAFDSLGVSTI